MKPPLTLAFATASAVVLKLLISSKPAEEMFQPDSVKLVNRERSLFEDMTQKRHSATSWDAIAVCLGGQSTAESPFRKCLATGSLVALTDLSARSCRSLGGALLATPDVGPSIVSLTR